MSTTHLQPPSPVLRLTGFAARLTANRPLALSLVSLLSLLTYLFGLLLPYNLFTLKLKPLLNIPKLTQGNPVAQAQFVLTFALLSGLYYLAWRLCRGQQTRRLWIILLVSALVFNLMLLFLYPIGAADIFDNILHARVTAVHGGNPFYDRPNLFPTDPFYLYAAWRKTPSAYGPLWELLAATLSRLVGADKLANILGFKLVNVLFYFGCLGLIALILRRHAPERALPGLALFALNPLVIYETAGNGHNDIVMAFFILLAMYFSIKDRHTFAALAVTAGVLIKFIPALILPILIVAGLRAQPTRPAQLRYLIVTALTCAALTLITYAPFWRNSDVLGLKRKEALFTASLPAMIQANLETELGVEESRRVVTNGALALTGLIVLIAMRRVWIETPQIPSSAWLVPIKASTFVLLIYLLFTNLWFQSWYTLWPLALAALLPEGETGRIAVLLSYSAVWKTIIFDFFLYTGGPLPPRIWRETLLGPATLGVTWLYGIYAALRKWRVALQNPNFQLPKSQTQAHPATPAEPGQANTQNP